MDAGFVAGDEITSYYDSMISKLIVRGSDRPSTIQKLHAALESYEIAGPITNVEFLKRVCMHPSFVAGDVETGFIPKHHADLFPALSVPSEVFAQAALFGILHEAHSIDHVGTRMGESPLGFSTAFQDREVRLSTVPTAPEKAAEVTTVYVKQKQSGVHDLKIGDHTFSDVRCEWNPTTRTLVSFFPAERLDTRLILDDGVITAFQHGMQYRLRLATPIWLESALDIKDAGHSVLATMPCKILRVEVEEGQEVRKDQALLVIESMKMETVIRSPQDGKVVRLSRAEGAGLSFYKSYSTTNQLQDLCKAGTTLIEFEE